jgi:type IV pilus assembly protein PilA
MKASPLNPSAAALLLASLLTVLPGCQKSAPAGTASAALVPAAGRSKHFEAVNRQLELGGTVYGYMDIDGDAVRLAEGVKQLMGSIPEAPPPLAAFQQVDLTALLGKLGVSDVKAVGLSSVPIEDGMFGNRIFVYTPNGRHGLLAALGGEPAPFTNTRLAPADTDFYMESEIDLPAVYTTIKEVVGQVAGEATVGLMESALKQGAAEAGVTPLDVIRSLKGRMLMLGRLDEKKSITLPTPSPLAVPAPSLLIRIEGLGAVLEPVLAKAPPELFARTEAGAMKIYTLQAPLPVEGLKPVLAVENGVLYLATAPEFLAECRDQKHGLDQDPAFKRALAAVGEKGNSLSYVSPKLFDRLRELETLNPALGPAEKQMMALVLRQIPSIKQPLVSVGINLPDCILMRSVSMRSVKQDILMAGYANPVTIGLLAAMAVPAFQKVRAASQEKAITSNLRQLAAGADQYYVENGVNTVTYDKLVGPEKDKIVRPITPVAGEDYTKIKFRMNQPLSVTTAAGQTVTFGEAGGDLNFDLQIPGVGDGPPIPVRGGATPQRPAGNVGVEVAAIRASAGSLFQGNVPHTNFRNDLTILASAANAFTDNPTPAQTAAFIAALDTAIQRADGISQRASETVAARATAATAAAGLRKLKANFGGP